MSLIYIGQQITIYGGIFIFITGSSGNLMSILVFSSVHNYRTTPCTFYFLIASIFNIIYLANNLISRIVSTGYGIDLTKTSVSWCKLRVYIGNSVTLISLSCSCLATIDQFFVTSRNANRRRFSNIKLTYRILLIISLISCLHGIPILLFYNISSITKTCIDTNPGYAIYTPIYGTAVLCFIPVIIMIIFGYLTYYNINSIRILTEQQADRQLIRMILSQAISAFITFIPYGINIAYSQITSNISKDPYRLNIESFISMMTTLLSYIYYAVCLLIVCKIVKEFIFRQIVTYF
ncbi:unnamed protein product [Adineta steineri]|uniref:G-protein coupled receptors family 1 profile domain-containing protein n=1 Tax=Adineta steineri TaxID=433720 RepID=A0A819FPW9_9BILA|nr:unnamed protein product [Adineta steineri]